MARRRKKKNNSRKIWFVLILLCAVSFVWAGKFGRLTKYKCGLFICALSRRDFGIQREKQD
mgnify:CR=1 FL=1